MILLEAKSIASSGPPPNVANGCIPEFCAGESDGRRRVESNTRKAAAVLWDTLPSALRVVSP
jgi:hypothetical protein